MRLVGNEKTAGDRLFEAYLDRFGYQYDFEPDLAATLGVSITARPDYLVTRGSQRVVCEVKEFRETDLGRRLTEQRTIVASDKETHGPIRGALREAANNVRQLEGAGVPLVAVLTNPHDAFVDFDPDLVTGAMLGRVGHVLAIDLRTQETVGEYRRAGRDGVLARERGYISAVAVIYPTADAADVYLTGDDRPEPLPSDFFARGRGDLYGHLPDGRYGLLSE